MSKLACFDEAGKCSTAFFEREFTRNLFSRYLSADAKRSASVVLDLSHLSYADLLELLSVAAASWYLSRACGYRVRVNPPLVPHYRDSREILSGAGFFQLLNELGVTTTGHELAAVDPNIFYRLANISSTQQKDDARRLILTSLAHYYPWMDADQCFSFDKIINEALENCLEHAYNAIETEPCARIVAVRRYSMGYFFNDPAQRAERLTRASSWLRELALTSSTDYLEIAIVDVGVGISTRIRARLAQHLNETLSPRRPIPAELDDLSALLFVLSRHKTTSAATDEGRGYGLYKLKNHVQAWNGLFQLRSGRARITSTFVGQREKYERALHFFPGTQIRVLLPMVDRVRHVRYVLGREAELK
jgi:hypothetical protein